MKLEEKVVKLLLEKNFVLACAESCTGGLVAKRITDISGSSAVFNCGVVSYSNEIKEKVKDESGYWITTNVKTDKDGDTIIVVYVGHKDSNEKAQFFIKPEKGQLTIDHKDMDPAKILSKIEVHFKGRILTQEFED